MSVLALLLVAPLLGVQERHRFEDAIARHLRDDLRGAASDYGALLEDHPDFAPARFYRAEALWLTGEKERAKADLAALGDGAKETLLYRLLATTFGVAREEREDVVTKLLHTYPLDERRFLATGTPALILLSTGDFDDAANDYRRIAVLDPEDVTLHRQLGTAFAKARQWVAAIEAFERVVEAVPEDVVAWRQIGTGNLVLQRWSPAIEAFERALRLRPDEPNVLLALGYAYERKPDYDSALGLYRRAAERAPEDAAPRYRIGRALLALSKVDEAERALKEARDRDPSMPEPLSYLGELYLRRGETERAIESLSRAIAIDPDFFEAYYHLAQAYRRSGRDSEAREAIERYAEIKSRKRHVPSQEEVLATSGAAQAKRRDNK